MTSQDDTVTICISGCNVDCIMTVLVNLQCRTKHNDFY